MTFERMTLSWSHCGPFWSQFSTVYEQGLEVRIRVAASVAGTVEHADITFCYRLF